MSVLCLAVIPEIHLPSSTTGRDFDRGGIFRATQIPFSMLRAQNLLTAVKLEAINSARDASPPANQNPSVASSTSRPLLSVSKPSWIVRTESNVRKERRKKPDPPCVVCNGSGRIDCHSCKGTGRTNYTHLTILPKGEWPKWCRSCGGSGLSYCSRCLGTGEYRYIMGFQFMKIDGDQHQGTITNVSKETGNPDLFLTKEQLDLNGER